MEKLNIAIVGCRNVGKSSLFNALTGQNISIVSATPGTTTDPVKKSYEIPDFASVVFFDTAGMDDRGELGQQRIEKTYRSLALADIALFVFCEYPFGKEEKEMIRQLQSRALPFLMIRNKSDLFTPDSLLEEELQKQYQVPVLHFSNLTPDINPIIEALKKVAGQSSVLSLTGDILHKGDIALLVTPIDTEAPVGRLILPQVQTIRDILDHHCVSIVLQPDELNAFLSQTGIKPHIVITDSQVFGKVASTLPENIALTSFSILLARQKGNFEYYIAGTPHLDHLKNGDRILLLESCSHHSSCEDIGRVKLPALLRRQSGKTLEFDIIAGVDTITRPVSAYALVIQCGGCMVTSGQLKKRLHPFIEAGIPITNYGMALAYLSGIFKRATAPFRQ